MDLNIFENLDTVYITGHKNPDADSLVSAKIMQDILTHFGIDARWVFFEGDTLGKGDRLLCDILTEKPLVLRRSETGDKKFLLVDHNDVSQSVEKVDNAIAAIDHHVNSGQLDRVYMSDYCCTALYIYTMFRDRYSFSPLQKQQIFRAFLSDSVFGKSSRYKEKDAQAVREMGFGNDYTAYFEKYFTPTDLTDYKKAFANNGKKSFKFSWGSFDSVYIEATDTLLLEEFKKSVEEAQGDFLGIWVDYSAPQTFAFFKFKGQLYSYHYSCIASRAATIMPQIVKTFG